MYPVGPCACVPPQRLAAPVAGSRALPADRDPTHDPVNEGEPAGPRLSDCTIPAARSDVHNAVNRSPNRLNTGINPHQSR